MPKNTSKIQARYDATHCKRYSLKFHIIKDEEIVEKLSSVESVQGYIKKLILADIESTGLVQKNSKEKVGKDEK